MNDFFKFNSVTLPNEYPANMATNKIFSMKIIRKNGNEIFLMNTGIVIENTEVAATQVKIIFFRLSLPIL